MHYRDEYIAQGKKRGAADEAWRQLRDCSEILLLNPFIIGANLTQYRLWEDNEGDRIDYIEKPIKFITHGFTKIDIIAEMMALNAYLFLKMLLINPFLACGTKIMYYLEEEKTWLHLPLKIIGALAFVGVCAAFFAGTAATYLSWFALKIALRTVSTVLGLIAAPINHAYNLINDADKSETRKQDYLLGSGIFIGLAGIALAAATFGGLMTPAVLGTSAFALTLISIAWPLAIGAAATGVAIIAGVGLYNLFNHCYKGHQPEDKQYDSGESSDDEFNPEPVPSPTGSTPASAPGSFIL